MVHLEHLYEELIKIRQRLTDIERAVSETRQPIRVEESVLLRLPDNLRRSYLTVATLEKADAYDVSAKTGRSRAIESFYLNQLERMGWLEKRRERKSVFFTVSPQTAPIERVNDIDARVRND